MLGVLPADGFAQITISSTGHERWDMMLSHTPMPIVNLQPRERWELTFEPADVFGGQTANPVLPWPVAFPFPDP